MHDLWELHGEVTAESWDGRPIVVTIVRVPTREGAPFEAVDVQRLDEPGPFHFIVDPGRYRVLAYEDLNDDQSHQPRERIAFFNEFRDIRREQPLRLHIEGGRGTANGPAFVAMAPTAESRSILLGEVRPLSDPRFGPEVGRLGVWAPLRFMREQGAGLFFLEEHDPGKTPVAFIHGIGGYPQEFRSLIEGIDRERFEPWLVQYPSGWDLGEVAEFFERGIDEVALRHQVPAVCLVAHSMGGVVTRAMLNLHQQRRERHLRFPLFMSIASPLGGHPSAATGTRMSPFVVPAWRSLVPEGELIQGLHGGPLPEELRRVLFFTLRDDVVPVRNQLPAAAQEEADFLRGLDASHGGVLLQEELIGYLRAELDRCREASQPEASQPEAITRTPADPPASSLP